MSSMGRTGGAKFFADVGQIGYGYLDFRFVVAHRWAEGEVFRTKLVLPMNK